ncbi:hypothetical protein [Psychromarinibacter sp. S121]|uniref:hypothetical protein n=1 Tax=Psychromarinibacter sp. S121 TaxID=3415127 RepID=UPI003C7DBB42
MRQFFDLQHPFFLPVWRRVGTEAACLGWGGLELAMGHPGWAAIFAVIGLFCLWEFFIVWDDEAVRARANED